MKIGQDFMDLRVRMITLVLGLMTSLDEGAEQIFQQRAGLLLGDPIQSIIPGILIPGSLAGAY